MRIQCLVAKGQGWEPEPGDEDFEVDAKHCFVTGIAGKIDEFDAYGFQPVKHGVEDSMINTTDDDDTVSPGLAARGSWNEKCSPADMVVHQDEPWGLPMHPACFQM